VNSKQCEIADECEYEIVKECKKVVRKCRNGEVETSECKIVKKCKNEAKKCK
jgi:hypothetical protein